MTESRCRCPREMVEQDRAHYPECPRFGEGFEDAAVVPSVPPILRDRIDITEAINGWWTVWSHGNGHSLALSVLPSKALAEKIADDFREDRRRVSEQLLNARPNGS